MLGNFLSGRLSSRIGINRMLLMGNLIAAGGMTVPLILYFAGYVTPASLFVPVMFVGLGNGMTLPNAMAGIVSVRPHLAGSASGLGGAMQIGGGAGLSVLAGGLLGPETGPAPLLWVMLASSSLGIVAALYVMNVAARKGELAR